MTQSDCQLYTPPIIAFFRQNFPSVFQQSFLETKEIVYDFIRKRDFRNGHDAAGAKMATSAISPC